MPLSQKSKKRSTLAQMFVAFTIGFGSFQLIDHFWADFSTLAESTTPDTTEPNSTTATTSPLQTDDVCQLSTKACTQQGASIQLSDDIVHPLKATEITVFWPELPQEITTLVLSLEGLEMMMGVYRLKLTKNTSGEFRGELMLPFCTSKEMTWQGTIEPFLSPEQIKPINVSLRMTK
ncbi:hypothetical protein [Photobacterium lipolyticum]|uniref:Uncharacterized protein n=1 Tax=Photobacterium lipolyticum TaxID=266810 RepID=A0A2T3MSD9_9GAMM|nr:hypothetical protein [Photobacterium lipolyticum]PSW00139.1 hypothetical protein C9I89_21470 [Photobacterium lipolyticum]